MGIIIDFMDAKAKNSMSRVEALCKDRILYFTCDECGADIEVINDVKPERCPGCGLIIEEWKRVADD